MTIRSKTTNSQPEVGFIVEGDLDKLIVETLAQKIAARLRPKREFRFATIRLSGSPRVRYMYPEIRFLLEKGCNRVIVVFDTDTTDEQGIKSFVASIKARLKEEELEEGVTLVPVVPEIETWILADEAAIRETTGVSISQHGFDVRLSPKAILAELLGKNGSQLEQVIARLRPQPIHRKDASFRAFEQSLTETLETHAAQPIAV